MWIVKGTGNKKVLWSSVEGGLTDYKRSTWHLHIFLYVSTGKRIELPGNVALWFLYWSGSICATCGWHDWSISSCSALALLITLLNIATGEALLEAAVTSPEQWCTLAPPFNPFFWHYRIWMGHQWSHSVRTCSGAPGWPGAEPSTPVNGLPPQPIELHELRDQREVRQRCPSARCVGQGWTKADSDNQTVWLLH